jgi:hypothetical protein
MSFRHRDENIYTSWCYLGTFSYIFYYRDAEFREYSAYSVKASGLEVGQISVDDEYYLYRLPNFMLQSIGTTLIRLANDTTHEPDEPPRILVLNGQQYLHTRQDSDEYQLTEGGWALIQHCRNIGVFQHYLLIGITPSGSPGYSPNHD